MSAVQEIGRLDVGEASLRQTQTPKATHANPDHKQGAYMIFYRDDSKPEDAKERYYSHTICDGKPGSLALEVPRHWHDYHDEYMKCIEGQLEVSLDDKIIIAKPGEDALFIERGHVHGFKFPKGQRAVLQELTDPTGEFKQRFFEDIFEKGLTFWTMMRGFADGDTYIAFTPFRWLDLVCMAVLGFVARWRLPREGGVIPKSIAPSMPLDGKKMS